MGKNKSWCGEYTATMAMVGLQFIYAGNSLSAKAAFTEGMSPMVFIVYRQACASLFLVPTTFISVRRGGGRVALGMKGFSLVFFTAFIGVTFNQYLYYQGLKLASASLASAIANMIPAVTFVMAAFVGLERVDMRSPRTIAKIFGTIICVGGAIAMTLFKGQKLMTVVHTVDDKWMIGCLCLMGSSCCWSLWLILQVPICKSHLDPLSLSTWMCLLSSIQSAIFTFFLEPDLEAWRFNSWFEVGCCLYAGLIGSGVTFYVQSWCISTRGPLFSAMFSPLCTVVVTIFAILLLHEHLYTGSLLGGGAVVLGLYVVLWGKAKDYTDTSTKSFETETEEPLILEKNKLQDETDNV